VSNEVQLAADFHRVTGRPTANICGYSAQICGAERPWANDFEIYLEPQSGYAIGRIVINTLQAGGNALVIRHLILRASF
jgi:hypothetical protein